MNVLENLKYSRSHEWVEEVDETTGLRTLHSMSWEIWFL